MGGFVDAFRWAWRWWSKVPVVPPTPGIRIVIRHDVRLGRTRRSTVTFGKGG